MKSQKKLVDKIRSRIKNSSKMLFQFIILFGSVTAPIVFAVWIFWEWEPLKGRNFHRLVFQQNHQVGDALVSILHELEILADPSSQAVLIRILRPNILPPLASFYQGIEFDELSNAEQIQSQLFSMLPRTSVYRMNNCDVFSSSNWRCDVHPSLGVFTYGGGIEMRDGKFLGVRGDIVPLRIGSLIKRTGCEDNICDIRPILEYEDLLDSFRRN